MLTWLRRFFLGDDRLFLGGNHLNKVIRDNHFHGIPDVGDIVEGPNPCQLVLNYERDGRMVVHFEKEEEETLCRTNQDSTTQAI